MRSLLIGMLLLGWWTTVARAQVRVDPASGDYVVMVRDDNGQLVEMRVEPPNKVRVSLTPSLSSVGDRVKYRYVARVAAGSPQQLAFVEIDCPPSASVGGLTATATIPGITVSWHAEHVDEENRSSCSFERGAEGLAAGGVLDAAFDSPLLPGIGQARVFGKTAGVNWPTSDPNPDNDEIRGVVANLSGETGGWITVAMVTPARDRAQFADPRAGVNLIRGDEVKACGPLGWITSAGVCHSLQVKLDQASASLSRGDMPSAKGQLGAFLDELEGQHGPEPGKHVTDNAYWLLSVNARFVLTRL
jgi:hypothetical protein